MIPQVSIIITCFNYGRYVAQAIESVLSQTFQDFELIVINDGSTDNTEEIASGYRCDRLRYYYQPNQGQSSAKNKGIREAQGSFIAFLDADDLWEPNKLSEQMPLFKNSRVGVVYSRQLFIDQASQPFDPQPASLPCHRGFVLKELLKDNFVPFSSAVVRKKCFEHSGLFDENLKMSIDWDLWLKLAMVYEFDYCPQKLLHYRLAHEGQMSGDMITRLGCCDKIFERFLALHHDSLAPKDIQEAKIYTYNSRGYFYRRRSPKESLRYYAWSLKENPWQWTAAKGMVLTSLGGLWR